MLEFYPNLNINFLHGSNGPPPHTDDLSADGAVKRELGCECCVGCGRPIQDRYIVRVGDSSYHERCMTCCACGVFLEYSCFMRDDKPYCKNDYDRLFGAKCFRCGDTPLPQEMVMRVQHHVFHMLCFKCVVCCQPLQKGELFVMRAGHLFCRQDFEKELVLQQVDDDLLIDETGRPRDGRRGPKRPRTILTSAQRRQFKASFEVSPKPCRKVREALAKETGLSVRVVQVWFQNQRAKMKKIQRKSKQDVSDKDKDKEDRSTKQESSSGENGHYSGMDSLTSQPLNPNMPFSPDVYHGNSVDSFGSSEISIDGSNFDQIDEGTSDTMSQTNMDLHHSQGPHGNSHHDHGLPSTSVSFINPIDKLYLMQNSYFSSDN